MAERPSRSGAAALALRLAGASYVEVADALGLPGPAGARTLVEEALEARAWNDIDGRERMRAEAGARVERLLRSVWTKATSPDHPEHLPAVRVARELIDRYIRLYGLDAPAEVVVHTPTTAEIDTWVATIVSTSTADLKAMEAPVVETTARESA